LKVENWGGVTGGEGVWGHRAEEMAARERQSLSILCVKKEAKLSAREVDDVKEGKGDAHWRWSSLFTVCQRRRGKTRCGFSCHTIEWCFSFLEAKFRYHEFRGSPRTSALKKGTFSVDIDNLTNNPQYIGNGAR